MKAADDGKDIEYFLSVGKEESNSKTFIALISFHCSLQSVSSSVSFLVWTFLPAARNKKTSANGLDYLFSDYLFYLFFVMWNISIVENGD